MSQKALLSAYEREIKQLRLQLENQWVHVIVWLYVYAIPLLRKYLYSLYMYIAGGSSVHVFYLEERTTIRYATNKLAQCHYRCAWARVNAVFETTIVKYNNQSIWNDNKYDSCPAGFEDHLMVNFGCSMAAAWLVISYMLQLSYRITVNMPVEIKVVKGWLFNSLTQYPKFNPS